MPQTCSRRLQFSAGHRVYNHEGKCANLHGHNYVLWVYARAARRYEMGNAIGGIASMINEKQRVPTSFIAEAKLAKMNEVTSSRPNPDLDFIGRVIDFSVLKIKLGEWIDLNWDHGFIFYEKDIELRTLFQGDERFIRNKSFMARFNPTAEEMAQFLLNEVCPYLFAPNGVEIYKIGLYETENCYAEASLL